MSEPTLAMGIADWFRDGGHAALAACAVSVLALVVSILAWVTSWRTQKRQVAIEDARELDRIAQTRKAQLVARIVREPPVHPTSFYLEVENKGTALARDVSITLDRTPVLGHAALMEGQEEVTCVGRLSLFRYGLYAPSCPYPRSIRITWSDDSGEPGLYETTLT